MTSVSVQLNVYCRNGTDRCSATGHTTSTTQTEEAHAVDTWTHAANEADVNVIHYQWGQENLTPSAAGPIRPETVTTSPTNQNGVSPDDGYAT